MRRFLTTALCGALFAAALASAAADTPWWTKTLVLIQVQGGDDGLNVVVPYADPAYAAARPTIAVPRDQVLPLGGGLGLAPSLRALFPAWQAGDLAVVLGLGYPDPNFSHFRSIDIWNTASPSDRVLATGWVARAFAPARPPRSLAADAVVIGSDDLGPLRGLGMRTVVINDPRQFVREAAAGMSAGPAAGGAAPDAGATAAERRLVEVQQDTVHAARAIRDAIAKTPGFATEFPETPLGRQMETAATLLAGGLQVPVIKLTLGGFDTHTDEKARQPKLLEELAGAVAAFRDAMREKGLWNDVLVVTYSEFGRRVQENASGGTDHGTAAPQFVLGGAVKGGLVGREPSLSDLDGGDLRFTTDFRSLYATIAREWWGLGTGFLAGGPFPLLPLFKGGGPGDPR
jgi:uncharacterized protein (DUF1501 family)